MAAICLNDARCDCEKKLIFINNDLKLNRQGDLMYLNSLNFVRFSCSILVNQLFTL